jgi:hypothetical protein
MPRLQNFSAAQRKSMMPQFGLMPQGEDLSWVENMLAPPSYVDLAPQIVGGPGQAFLLPATPGAQDGSVDLRWNGTGLQNGVGYTRLDKTITMAAEYEPALGDTLEAWVWGEA